MPLYRSNAQYEAIQLPHNPADFRDVLRPFTQRHDMFRVREQGFLGQTGYILIHIWSNRSVTLHPDHWLVWKESGDSIKELSLYEDSDFQQFFEVVEKGPKFLPTVQDIVAGTEDGRFVLIIKGQHFGFFAEQTDKDQFWIALRDALVSRFPVEEAGDTVTLPRDLAEDLSETLKALRNHQMQRIAGLPVVVDDSIPEGKIEFRRPAGVRNVLGVRFEDRPTVDLSEDAPPFEDQLRMIKQKEHNGTLAEEQDNG